MSFHEKSAWSCLIAIIAIYAAYFWIVFQQPIAAVGLFVVAALALALLLTAFHVVNALATRSIRKTGSPPRPDELDNRIELIAAKWAGFILAFAVVAWIVISMYSLPSMATETYRADLSDSIYAVPVITAMAAVQYLFAGFVLANVVYYGTIVAAYRRMARA